MLNFYAKTVANNIDLRASGNANEPLLTEKIGRKLAQQYGFEYVEISTNKKNECEMLITKAEQLHHLEINNAARNQTM
ncbi:hypothetical protein Lsan_3504 [Legionella santicrucis]|uniref:Uncharacterized protein n=1 Tax=Legionella santicrucis TaxID=45074 RepID=A0A0W0YAI8_9GAMM|nr:hypothetical protein [Legionella santicrucis]KTD53840.1 hypothetical protein Lsan_3504 [Legionella santicrucis]